MTLRKDEAINNVLAEFEELANLVLLQLDHLETQLLSGELTVSPEILEQVNKNEKHLDKQEVKLSEKIVNTIVLYQPVASEIRKIISCYRMVISLERIGDHTISIFKYLENIKSKAVYTEFADVISNMLLLSISMVKNSLISFTSQDKELAIWTIKNDSVASEMNQKMLKKAIGKGKFAEEKKSVLLSFITIKEMVSNIERIADHAANIAEAAIYSFEGREIRHHRSDETD